ncbi:MAG: hypothetical protein V1837_05840 [Candidatus Woesearchaeota archaeon]
MDQELIINIGIILTIVAVYLLTRNKSKGSKEYSKLYEDIINGDEHKVKGKHY